MREGSLEAPVRHSLDWENPEFYSEENLDDEMRRVFDICHGCRRCFNLCDSFPRLFDLVDSAPSGELDSVVSADFKPIVDACTLCDLCFMTKCPYVPPHEFNLDFPHLMLRYRAVELEKQKHKAAIADQLTETDRNGKMAAFVAPLVNLAAAPGLVQGMAKRAIGVDPNAHLPKFHGKTLMLRAMEDRPQVNQLAPAFGRKAVIYATCFANYNNPQIGEAARQVLARNGVETEVVYPRCCGMPQLEKGDIARVAEHARDISQTLIPYIDAGYDVIALVPSCSLMMKFEWQLILPRDPEIKKVSEATYDISEYIVDIARNEGLARGLEPLEGGVALHIACHARAQNMGQKATEMLKLIPGHDIQVIERCSGHGGAWGVKAGNFDIAVKIGRPVAKLAAQSAKRHVASECPLAGAHILQGMEMAGAPDVPRESPHPIELFARAYGIEL